VKFVLFDQDYSDFFFVFNEDESELLSGFDVVYAKTDVGLMTNRTYAKETRKPLFILKTFGISLKSLWVS
jgi:hypothetical protein